MCPNLAFVQRLFQLLAQGVAVGTGARHVRRIGADRTGTISDRVIRCDLRRVKQRAPGGFGHPCAQTKADGTRHVKPRRVQADRGRHRGLQARRQLHHGFQIKPPYRSKHHRKPATLQSRHRIADAQDGAQPFGTARQHLGLGSPAISVNQQPGVIELHDQAGRVAPRNRNVAQNVVHLRDNLRTERKTDQAVGQRRDCRLGNPKSTGHGQHQRRAKRDKDQRSLATKPERGQRHRRQEHHPFGSAQLRQNKLPGPRDFGP